ncbi:MAG: AAA family ATPase [Armatimonadetes bacterium]|nr:AAA family ATPase [Armatimonadota bacterium]
MQALLDFANHGLLPFTGRKQERAQIMAFWNRASDVQTLRAALVVGEAGVGKSRLFDELLPAIEEGGGVVVRAKFHPGGATSVFPLLARSLWLSPELRALLKKEPEGSAASVSASLQRLSRLRRVMVALEDVHLLAGDSVREFAMLVGAIADEPIALLLSARPLELPVRGVIEPYLTLELELHGLSHQETEQMWQRLFSRSDDPELIAQLRHRTLGNPLALRSALRSAVRMEQVAGREEVWLQFDRSGFIGTLERNVRLLSEGMTAHLSPDERHAAEQLAVLGEVFAHETAHGLIENADLLIGQLIFKGVLATSHTIAKHLTQNASRKPLLAFTHTLLHRHLADNAQMPIERLMELCSQHTPLYSILPFQLLATNSHQVKSSSNLALQAFHGSLSWVYLELDYTSDWRLAPAVGKAMLVLLEQSQIRWEPTDHAQAWLIYLNCLIRSLRRDNDAPEWEEYILKYWQIAMSLEATELLHWRLLAINFRLALENNRGYPPEQQIAKEVAERLLSDHPELARHESYLRYAYLIGMVCQGSGNHAGLRQLKQTIDQALANPATSDTYRNGVRRNILPLFILMFETTQELEEAFAMLRQVEEIGAGLNLSTPMMGIRLHYSIGAVRTLIPMCDNFIRHATERQVLEYAWESAMIRQCALWLTGSDPAVGVKELIEFHHQLSATQQRLINNSIAAGVAWLVGAGDVAAMIAEQFTFQHHYPQLAVMLLVGSHDTGFAELLQDERFRYSPIRPLVAARAEGDAAAGVAIANNLLAKPPVRIEQILDVGAVMTLITNNDGTLRQEYSPLEGSAELALLAAFGWLAERKMFPAVLHLLQRFGHLIDHRTAATWQKDAHGMAAEHRNQHPAEQTGPTVKEKIAITLIGRVEYTHPGQPRQPVRGGRMKTILGLLAADRIARRPLTKQEFYRMAAAEEGKDFELARKTVNMAIASLRKMIGDDAFLRDDETIRLNFQRVQVDVVRVHEVMKLVESLLRERAYGHAREQVIIAAAMFAGEVPFPGLYEEYFEALREDLETRMRALIVEVGKTLLREGDPVGSEQVLAIGFDWLPDDEELGELLCQSLIQSGRRAEAERIRLRSQLELG